MYDLISRNALRELAETEATPCISLYMPTHVALPDILRDPIRLRNLLEQVEEELLCSDLRRPKVDALLAPARALLDNGEFWQNQSNGLALFLSPQEFHYFRMPIDFDERCRIADRFHVKPLLPYFDEGGHYFILAISQSNVRLFQATRYRIDAMPLDNTPTSLAEALKYDAKDREMLSSTGERGSHGGRGAAPQFHGHGAAENDPKGDLRRFFQQVDEGVVELLRQETAPLVLAGVEYLHPIYAEASKYRNLVTAGLTGNPDQLSAEELHEQTWPIVEPHFRAAREAAVANYYDLRSQRRASSNIRDILPAAYSGRINTAFTAIGRQQWGTFDAQNYAIHISGAPSPENEDLINLVAIQTLLHDGEVYALPPEEMPDGADVAAVYRY